MANVDCFDSRQGDQIKVIKDLRIQERISWFGGEPSLLKETREHWFSCPQCRVVLPTGREDFEAIKRGWDHIAVERLAKVYSDYSAEFDPTPRPERDSAHYAERVASLGSIYARRVEWGLSWITERPWDKFTVRIDTGDSDQSVPLSSCAEQLRSLSPEVLQFVFEAVQCGELYFPLYKRLERKTVESFIRFTPAGEPNEITPNPEYPDFESFKNSVEVDEDEGQDDYNELLGDWVTNRFIRLKMLEVFLESQIAHEFLFESLNTAAEGYRKQFEDRFGLPTGSFLDGTQRPATTLIIGANNLAALRKELTDDFDSLRAGQMEILRRLENISPSAASSTAALEPAVEAKLGQIYFKLHEVTRQALAFAEYQYDINNQYHINKGNAEFFQGPVNLIALAYEHEMFRVIFEPYLDEVRASGVADYTVNERNKEPMIKNGELVERSQNLGNYCWHLKNDEKLKEWILKTKRLQLLKIRDGANWLNQYRNRADHQLIFPRSHADEVRERVYSETGLLGPLHWMSQ